tara:strand:- start:790 stop:2544 length:1755 start_codon:yes stop_codon:yes gene_type:complete
MENIHLINLSSYVKPEVIEDKKSDWVNYGKDNDYYSYLIDLYTNSTTNNAIINGISQLIYGRGLDALNSNEKPDQYAMMKSIFSDSCLRKMILDLKMLGEGSFQILYQNGKVVKAEHFPRQTLRAEKMNTEGEIQGFYYHPNWKEAKRNETPKRIAAFGFGNGKEPEIKIVKRYVSGFDYYCPQDYETSYCEMEKQISSYLINDIMNGFSGTKIINFNNGLPDMDAQYRIKNDVLSKLTGSHGEKVIVSFNNNQETKTTVDDIPLNDAPGHYEYLSRECQNKLIVAHRVTSPLLLGIRTENNGLGSNADEIETASLLFQNTTIRPYQDLIIESIDDILAKNNISLNIYFKTLQPLEFIDTKNAITDETREEETGVKLSKDERPFLDDEKADELWEMIKDLGEDENLEEYELIDVEDTSDEPEDFDVEDYLNGLYLAATDDSSQDDKRYKVRYKYVKGTRKQPKGKSRPFCINMMKNGKIYRKEDISQMSARGVNKKHGHKGRNYSIFKYQGGLNCYHRFERRIYKKRLKKDGSEWGGNALDGTKFVNVNQAVREGFKLPKNPKEVSEANITRKDRGMHPNNPNR